MSLIISLVLTLLLDNSIQCYELNSIFGRITCYNNEQLNCSQEFIDAYPELSRSATNLSVADTHFLLFTRRNPYEPEKLHKCGGALPPTTQFDPSQDLIIILHPYVSGFCNVAVYREWLYQILQRGNYNVMAVDYSWGNSPDYGTAILNLKVVAKQTVKVLENIQDRMGNISVTIVGLSLGAQLAGLIGQDFPVRKITALDPSGPGFDATLVPAEERLDRDDADFVEVWFCNRGRCLPNLGTPYHVGHVHFYLNDGNTQKGCQYYGFISLLKGDFISGFGAVLFPNICSHTHCTQYYKVAINPGSCQFVGVRCNSYIDFKLGRCRCAADGSDCIVMGFDTENNLPDNVSYEDKYYVSTTDKCPYCDDTSSYLGSFGRK